MKFILFVPKYKLSLKMTVTKQGSATLQTFATINWSPLHEKNSHYNEKQKKQQKIHDTVYYWKKNM